MTENEPTLTVSSSNLIGPARVENSLPAAYRLVTKDDGNGNTIYQLQAYFTWTQGWFERGGEWRDLETQDWLHAKDDVPFGHSFRQEHYSP